MKKLIAFDQDDTLNVTKLPIDAQMAALLAALLDRFRVCVISGTNWEVMRKNDIDPLPASANLNNLTILPTTGTQYWRFVGTGDGEEALSDGQIVDGGWKREYAYFLTEAQAAAVTNAIEEAARDLGYWCANPKGEIIENRGSQVTFSALGQWASPQDKHAWDPDMQKRRRIVERIRPQLASLGLKVGIGGATSIDVTLPDIDKAYGMRRLMEQTGLRKADILFVGDKLAPGGNDYPVKALGIDTIAVRSAEDTKLVVRGILGVTG